MKKALLIAAGTVTGLGAVLSITPPALSESAGTVGLGGGNDLGSGASAPVESTTPTPTASAAPAATASATAAPTPTPSKSAATKKSTPTPVATSSATASAAPTQTPSATPTPTPVAPTRRRCPGCKKAPPRWPNGCRACFGCTCRNRLRRIGIAWRLTTLWA